MVEPEVAYSPHRLEEDARTLWRGRRLPPAGGLLGRSDGPVLRQFLGAIVPTDRPVRAVQRALAADVDARYAAISGRRAIGTLRQLGGGPGHAMAPIDQALVALGIWVGGDGAHPSDDADRTEAIRAMIGRLARRGSIVARDVTLRVCPKCAAPRTPERIVYQAEEGDTFLIRFPAHVGDQDLSLLVWVDAPWRLLGTSALLVNPELPYVIARFRRKDRDEWILTARSSLDRIRDWVRGADLEVVREVTGATLVGTPYDYPLKHEFPMGGSLEPPSGTVQAVGDVGDSGTGIVPLVPGHGGTDAQISERLKILGWPLLTARGQLDLTLMHKYAGLDLDSANEFVVRDLSEAGGVFARLRVRRGVPHCSVCGSGLVWTPGRAWCLEPGRLPRDAIDLYRRLLPHDPPIGQIEVAPWPISETTASSAPTAVPLLECGRCERLDTPQANLTCPCGGHRRVVFRMLLPSVQGVFGAWARSDPYPIGDPARLYVNHRRRVPAIVHHLTARSVVEGTTGDVTVAILPSVAEVDLAELLTRFGSDAVRGALVRTAGSDASAEGLTARCRQEHARLTRLAALTQDVAGRCDRALLAGFGRPIGGFLGELETEDRALLARWERSRVQIVADFDRWSSAAAHRRLFHFLDVDLAEYRRWVAPRLALPGNVPSKRAALRSLGHVLRSAATLLAPIAPFLAEAVHRAFSTDATSLFEETLPEIDRALLDDARIAAWDRWRSVVAGLERFRHTQGIPEHAELASIALVVADEALAGRLRAEADLLARLGRVARVEVGSPSQPWTGRQTELRPNEAEIQRAYPSLATQIVHLLQRTPPRRGKDGALPSEMNVVIQGLPRRIAPSMFEYVQTLPRGVEVVPWSLGEMYVARPTGTPGASPSRPSLSADAFWLVARLAQRLRKAPPEVRARPLVAIAIAQDPLAEELRQNAGPIAEFLGLAELRTVDLAAAPRGSPRIDGRTRTGARWSVHLPDVPPLPPAPRELRSRRRPRAPAAPTAELGPAETDYADEAVVQREQQVRALGEELDGLLGSPLLGPAKVAGAWDAGLTTVAAFGEATFETVASLPGFGVPVASELFAKLGKPLPVRRAARPALVRRTVPLLRPTVRSGGPPASLTPPRLEAPPPPLVLVEPTPVPSMELAPEGTARPAAPEDESAPPAVPPAPPTSDRPDEPEATPETVEPAPDARPPTPLDAFDATTSTTGPDSSSPTAEPSEPSSEGSEGRLDPSSESTESSPAASPPAALELPSAAEAPAPVSLEGDDGLERPVEPTEPAPSLAEPTAAPPVEPVPDLLEATPSPPAEELPAEPSLPEATTNAEPEPTSGPEDDLPPIANPPEETNPSSTEIPPPPEVLTGERTPTAPELAPEAGGVRDILRPAEAETPPAPEPTGPPRAAPEVSSSGLEGEPGEPSAPPSDAPAVEVLPIEGTVETVPLAGDAPAPDPHPVEAGEEVPEPSSSVATPAADAPISLVDEPTTSEPAPAGPDPTTPPPVPAVEETVAPEPVPVRTEPSSLPPPASLELPPPVAAEAAPVVRPPVEVPPVPETIEAAALLAPIEAIAPAPTISRTGGIELTGASTIVEALQPFFDAAAAGHRGVAVVREPPERIRALAGSRPIEVLWLSNLGRGPTLKPGDLGGISTYLSQAVGDRGVTVVFLEGIEYLVRIHGVDQVLEFLAELDARLREHEARAWLHLTPDLLGSSDLDRLRAAFVRGAAPGG